MYELHYYPGNASFAPHVMLRELGLEFELKFVDRDNNAHKGPEYLALNPTGRIPALVQGDLVLFETAAICLHLADTHMEAGLAPKLGTADRAHFYKWLIFMTNTIQPDILMYYYNARYTTDPNGGPAIKDAAATRLMGWFQNIEDALQNRPDDGPHFMGDTFTILDIYLLMVSRWGRFLPTPPRDMPKVNAIVRAALERPSVRAAIAAEGITGDFLT